VEVFEVAVGADSLPYDDRVLDNLICFSHYESFATPST